MTNETYPVEDLIPHRGRMKLIDEVLHVDDEKAVTGAMVSEAWPLFDGQAVDGLVLVELVAQTAGIHISVIRRREGPAGRGRGWIVGIKDVEFDCPSVPLHTRLITTSRTLYGQETYSVIEGTVEGPAGRLCQVVLQVFREESIPEGDQRDG